jgi:hypothetical protein
MKKPRGAKVAKNTPSPGDAMSWKSSRRILRIFPTWDSIAPAIAAGAKPDVDDLAFLLRLGEPVPAEVQKYLADLLDPPHVGRGRPKKQPGQLEADRLEAAAQLFAAIDVIRRDADISIAKACAAYAAFKRTGSALSIERQYWDAKKKLAARLSPNWFLSHEDYLAWERKQLKTAKNK